MRLRRAMSKLRCMFRVLLYGSPDDGILDQAAREAKRRHDHAIKDLTETMETLTSDTGNKK